MKAISNWITLGIAAVSLAVSLVAVNRPGNLVENTNKDSSVTFGESHTDTEIERLKKEIAGLRRSIGSIQATPESGLPITIAPGEERPDEFVSINDRIGALESSVSRLQSNYNGISIESASAERAEIFASEEGAIKADEYFEAGKFAIAAEGYMTYYRNHPEDPDAKSILTRARDAYSKAGYKDMAIYLQEEITEFFPDQRAANLETLATMYKNVGDYDAAIRFADESASLTTDPQKKLWTRLYWAWYNELRDGPDAGLAAYQLVQGEIQQAGFTDHKLNSRAQEKIDDLLQRITASR